VSRRSPTNERYQKYTGPKGQTRKSAAAAKPSRKSADKGKSSPAKAKPKRSSGKSSFYEPDTLEYRRWRRLWWWSLGIGFLFVAISFAIQYLAPFKSQPWSRTAGFIILGLAYAGIVVALFIDWRKMRPLRQAGPGGKAPEKQADKSREKSAEKSDAGDSGEEK
jgi:hypothetical protein